MIKQILLVTLAALALLGACFVASSALVGCAAPLNPDGTPSTQPSGLTNEDVKQMAIDDFDAVIASGLLPETAEVDAAITAYFAVKADVESGAKPLVALNKEGTKVLLAVAKARQHK